MKASPIKTEFASSSSPQFFDRDSPSEPSVGFEYKGATDIEAELLIHYDFRNADSYASEGGEFIRSSIDGSELHQLIHQIGFAYSDSPLYSGEFLGDPSSVTGHFVDGASSLGANFDNNTYIEIEGAVNLEHGDSTFVFSQEKKSVGPELIFSSYSADPNDPRGFEFGINSANKLYFEYMDSAGPAVFTLNNIPHKKNIYTIQINTLGNDISLSWWDTSEQIFQTQTFPIDSNYIRNSDSWRIGTGIYSGNDGVNLQNEAYTYNGYLDRFIYFDGIVRHTELGMLCKGLHETMALTSPESGYIAGAVTGYLEELDQVISGITGYQEVITGYRHYTREFEKVTGHNLFGWANEGEDLYELDVDVYDDEDLYYRNPTGIYLVTEATGLTYGITGFATGEFIDTYSWSDPLFFNSGVEGALYNTYVSTPLTGDGYWHRVNDGFYTLSGGWASGYGPRSYTYLGARNPVKDFMETQKGINLFTINQFAGVDHSERFDGRASIVFSSDFPIDTDELTLAINGVSQPKGNLELKTDEHYANYYAVESGNYGVYVPGEDEYQYGSLNLYYKDDNLSLIVDTPVIEQAKARGENKILKITETGDYNSRPFSEIDVSSNKIFLNGHKIYEGIDYINNGGFYPIGDVLEITGVYSTEQDWRYHKYAPSYANITGFAAYDIHESSPFIADSYLSYLNGIKLDPKSFVQHDSSVDLLSQGHSFIMENKMKEIYNNKKSEFDLQETLDAGGPVIGPEEQDWTVYRTISEAGTVIGADWNPVADGVSADLNDPPEILNIEYEDL